MARKCRQCNIAYPLSGKHWHKASSNRDGFMLTCKHCLAVKAPPDVLCRACDRTLPLTKEFWGVRADTNNGFRSICKDCYRMGKSVARKSLVAFIPVLGADVAKPPTAPLKPPCGKKRQLCRACHKSYPLTGDFWYQKHPPSAKRFFDVCRSCNDGSNPALEQGTS